MDNWAQGLIEQALADLLGRSPEQYFAQFEQFDAFVLRQRKKTRPRHMDMLQLRLCIRQRKIFCSSRLVIRRLTELLSRSLPGLIIRGPLGWTLRSLMGLPHTLSYTGC